MATGSGRFGRGQSRSFRLSLRSGPFDCAQGRAEASSTQLLLAGSGDPAFPFLGEAWENFRYGSKIALPGAGRTRPLKQGGERLFGGQR